MLHLYTEAQLASEVNINVLVQPKGEFGTIYETVASMLKLLTYCQLLCSVIYMCVCILKIFF